MLERPTWPQLNTKLPKCKSNMLNVVWSKIRLIHTLLFSKPIRLQAWSVLKTCNHSRLEFMRLIYVEENFFQWKNLKKSFHGNRRRNYVDHERIKWNLYSSQINLLADANLWVGIKPTWRWCHMNWFFSQSLMQHENTLRQKSSEKKLHANITFPSSSHSCLHLLSGVLKLIKIKTMELLSSR